MNVDSAADTPSIATANSSANWTVRRALSERKRRALVIMAHRQRRRAQIDREAFRAPAGSDAPGERIARRPKIGVPNAQPRRRVGRVGELDDALAVRPSRPWAVGDDDEGAHRIVDVAAERDHSGLVE